MASAAVRIFFNQQNIGVIGPGGMIDQDFPHDQHFPYEVAAICGLYRAAFHGHGDADLQVFWSLQTCSMELRKLSSAAAHRNTRSGAHSGGDHPV